MEGGVDFSIEILFSDAAYFELSRYFNIYKKVLNDVNFGRVGTTIFKPIKDRQFRHDILEL